MVFTTSTSLEALGPTVETLLLNGERALIGLFLNWMLFGVLSVQIYLYWISFPNDRWFTKIMVYMILCLDIAQTFLVTADSFSAFALHFGNIIDSNKVNSTWFSVPAMSGWIASMVQSVYAYRIFKLSKSKTIYAGIMLLSLIQFGGSLAAAYQAKKAGIISGILGTNVSRVTVGIWEGGSALCDIIIAVVMTHYLRLLNLENKNQKTHDLLTRVVRLSFGTGTISASLALVTLALAYIPTQQSFWITSIMIIGKVYTNSIMVALNSRLKVEPNCLYPLWTRSDELAELPLGNLGLITLSNNNIDTPSLDKSRIESYIQDVVDPERHG